MKRSSVALAACVLLLGVCGPVAPRILDAYRHLHAVVDLQNYPADEDAVRRALASGIALRCPPPSRTYDDDDNNILFGDGDDDSDRLFAYVFSRGQLSDVCKVLEKFVSKPAAGAAAAADRV